MVCYQCKRVGYNFLKMEGKAWCGGCEAPGARTIGPGNVAFSGGGGGTVTGLPPLVPLHEWNEIIRLCKKVSARRSLTEGGSGSNLMEGPIKTLPLPNAKNPLDEKPTDKREGWTPLNEYFKTLENRQSQQSSPRSTYGNLFEG